MRGIISQVIVVQSAAQALVASRTFPSLLIGFDGSVDEIIHLIDERQDVHHFTRINSMPAFAQRISQAAGKSCNIEMDVRRTKLGGNGPIMANALLAQGFGIRYMGALGKDEIHPVFADFVAQCQQQISFADPGQTSALEFDDGKIMLGRYESFRDISWEQLIAKSSPQELAQVLDDVAMIACVNWTMLPFMNTIYEGLTELLGQSKTRSTVFIDLSDPRKRRKADIAEALDLLGAMQANADVILGLNESESGQVADVQGLGETENLEERAALIRDNVALHMVTIHPVAGAVVASDAGTFAVDGPYTSAPRLTTGAGDNFNAGFCAGYLAGLSPEQCLVTGVCTSGSYVRNGRSPERNELIDFMHSWSATDCGLI